jgi:gamma-glutamylputrescine oxidase
VAAGMSGDIFADDFKVAPYWWEDAAPFHVTASLPDEAELLIVGAGFCGLGAARRALELGIRPVVLDSQAIAGGASSRSGAMVSSGQKFLITGASAGLDSDVLSDLTSAHAEAFGHVRALASSLDMEGVFQASGRLFLAAVPQHMRRFGELARRLSEAGGLTTRVLGRQDLSAEIASSHYHGGLLVEEFGGLHPARFAMALARDVARRGAILRSQTAVKSVRREGNGYRVRTSAGDMRAREVLFATNAYTDGSLPSVRRRLASVGSYMLATAPLAPGMVDALMPGRRMFSDSKRNLWYFRPTPDGTRILFGARPGLSPRDPETAARLLHRYLTRVWPELAEVRISHAWTGAVAMTRSHLQHIGQHEGGWFAVGCNGSGAAIMPWLGRLAVERMLGERTTPTVFERLPFTRLPNAGGWPWYVPLAAGAFGFMDWLDRTQAGL